MKLTYLISPKSPCVLYSQDELLSSGCLLKKRKEEKHHLSVSADSVHPSLHFSLLSILGFFLFLFLQCEITVRDFQ